MLASGSLAMPSRTSNFQRHRVRRIVLLSLAFLLLSLNPIKILPQTEPEESPNSGETTSSADADSTAPDDDEEVQETKTESTETESSSSSTEEANDSEVQTSKEESANPDDDGTDEDDIAEIFVPSEAISEDIAVPFPVDI